MNEYNSKLSKIRRKTLMTKIEDLSISYKIFLMEFFASSTVSAQQNFEEKKHLVISESDT